MLGLPIGRFIYVMVTRGWWPGFAVFAYRHCVKNPRGWNAQNDGKTVRILLKSRTVRAAHGA
jgi:hypothetical protein